MNNIKRKYQLGEEWLYYKIYCGVRTADAILTNEISELTEQLLAEGLIDQWFFIRYKDPENHLRLRLRLSDTSKLFNVVTTFNVYFTPLLQADLVWKIQTETYSRELERYGHVTMELSEAIFYEQSEKIIKLLQKSLDDETYFIKVMQLINQFVSCFNLNDLVITEFLKERTKAFESEFKLDKSAKADISKKYLKLYPLIEKELNSKKESFSKLKVLINRVTQFEKDKKLELYLSSFLAIHIHMFVNRAFRDRQRFYEMLVYKYLLRNQLSVGKHKLKLV